MAEMYTNPIILCDYSDPDVIRAGDDYFLVASSFNFTPGLPILASKNLVDWTLVNYAAENVPLARYKFPQNAQGLWAPSFSYHKGIFYIIVATPDEGIFLTQSDNVFGDWSPLRCIHEARGIIDPFLFWDSDGTARVIHAYAKSRCGFNSKIAMLKFDPEKGLCSGNDEIIYDGTITQPTIEGPKVYKRGEFYYIFAPAGGVGDGWQTVLRSKNLKGPWEERIVLEKGDTEINGPHQGALVQTPGGEDWFIHFQERGIFGRITHLEPVVWNDDGWPLMGTSVKTGAMPGNPVTKFRSPSLKGNRRYRKNPLRQVRAFEDAALEWQWSGNHNESFAKASDTSMRDNESFKLKTQSVSNFFKNGFPVLWNTSNVLTQKVQYTNFYFKATLNVKDLPVGGRTGMIFMGDEYAAIAVERTSLGFDFVYLKSKNLDLTDETRDEIEICRKQLPLTSDGQPIKMRLDFISFSAYSGAVQFSVRSKNLVRTTFSWKSDYFSADNAQWVGGRFGLFAVVKKGVEEKGSALFTDVKVRH